MTTYFDNFVQIVDPKADANKGTIVYFWKAKNSLEDVKHGWIYTTKRMLR